MVLLRTRHVQVLLPDASAGWMSDPLRGGVLLGRYPTAAPVHWGEKWIENRAGEETWEVILLCPRPQAGSAPPMQLFSSSYKEK